MYAVNSPLGHSPFFNPFYMRFRKLSQKFPGKSVVSCLAAILFRTRCDEWWMALLFMGFYHTGTSFMLELSSGTIVTASSKGVVVIYYRTSNISLTLVDNKIVDHSDAVGASPVGVAPTTSSFSTWHHGFNGLDKDNCKTRPETFKLWNLVCLELEFRRCVYDTETHPKHK